MDRAYNAKHRQLGCSLSRMRRSALIVLIVLVYVCPFNYAAEDQATIEYRVKRAFVVNFLKFVDWPETSDDQSDQPFMIAIIGKIPFPEGSSNIPDVAVNQRPVVMTVHHQWNPDSENQKTLLEHCGALFITQSEDKSTEKLLAALGQRSVLTIGETDDFLDKGGIINFVVEENKVRFSVNLTHAKNANLEIRSKLLRLAKQVEKD